MSIQALNDGISNTNITVIHPPRSPLPYIHHSNMTVVSDDPSLLPIINSSIFVSYWIVAAAAIVAYDWALALGQEIELIWRQRWSLMTVLYLVIRYTGIPYIIAKVFQNMPFVSVTDAGCNIMNYALNWTNAVIADMLGVVTIARLYAMYQRSRKMLIFLIGIFLVANIACAVITLVGLKYIVGEELILSGVHMCTDEYEGGLQLLGSMVWMINTVWEVLALCLSVWVGVKHFRDLRRHGPSKGSTIGDCFRALIKSHVLYFASFVGVSCFTLGILSPHLWDSNSMGARIFAGALQILLVVQMFVLGPRLILGIREYHAKLVADSRAGTGMGSIAFQERVYVLTSSTV